MKTNFIICKMFLRIVLTAIFFIFCHILHAQVSGIVTDRKNHRPMAGVTILIKNTEFGVATDIKGHYQIQAQLHDTLVFSFIGCSPQEVVVTQKIHNVSLQEDQAVLSESIVTATYGTAPQCYARFTSPVKNTEEYAHSIRSTFLSAFKHPLSTFSVDVDIASYANMRRFINNGSLPPEDAIRTEELVNYFTYDYPAPKSNHPIGITTEVSTCPWNADHKLVHIGLRAKDIDSRELPPSNFVFLIDKSGSMADFNKLPLVKSSLRLLVSQLRDTDRIAIVTYAGETETTLPSTLLKNKKQILEAIEQLQANGYTAGGDGIRKAYEEARTYFIPKGNNRVILATDGDFNVGPSTEEELETLIERERKSGVFLTVLGFGMGNYKDNKLQILAQKGNGNHAYIDNLNEAKKVLVNEFSNSMYTIAKDVKLQVEFNPAKVQSYRLIGYESRLLQDEDFNNDSVDAGEIGIGHCVTALYEIIPLGKKGLVDPLKYQKSGTTQQLTNSLELLTVKLRYKTPDGNKSQKIEHAVIDKQLPLVKTSDNFRFAAAVAEFGMFLTHSPYLQKVDFRQIADLARQAVGKDPDGFRHEFIRLVETAGLLRE